MIISVHPELSASAEEEESHENESEDFYDNLRSPDRSPARRTNTDDEIEGRTKQKDIVMYMQDFICTGK